MSPENTAVKLDLKKTQGLTVEFADGKVAEFSLATLRGKCPCASCRALREQQQNRPRSLTVLPGNYTGPIVVKSAELVGNYALRIDWSDDHGAGIYSFEYLRGLMS